jgi:hypothetical protein
MKAGTEMFIIFEPRGDSKAELEAARTKMDQCITCISDTHKPPIDANLTP